MWKNEHKQVIDSFLKFLNSSSDSFVLKGGTALLKGYGLDRFSEDIDLDAPQSSRIHRIVSSFCDINGYTYNEKKNTPTAEKYTIHYNPKYKPLKIEVSHRARAIDESLYKRDNNILIYKLNPLCQMKTAAYLARDKIRDLYDIAFICNHHFESLSPETVLQLQNALENKGLEHFDYLMHTQEDELINSEVLEDKTLIMYEKLGLLSDDDIRSHTNSPSMNEFNRFPGEDDDAR